MAKTHDITKANSNIPVDISDVAVSTHDKLFSFNLPHKRAI
jgi:hypothetical protein